MKTHGEFPGILFRAFDSAEYAQQFLSGVIRFGSVVGYRKIEDKRRRDETEGLGHYSVNGVDNKTAFCSNVAYALCCHINMESAIETSHGKYVVEIAKPLYLAEEITKSIRLLGSKHIGGIEGVFVEYTKGESKPEKLDSYQNSRLTYSQKPKLFLSENEFRYVFICKKSAGDNLFIQLKGGIGGGVIHKYT